MSIAKPRTSLVLVAFASLVVGVGGAIAAGRALVPSRPAVVGVVDLEMVFNDSYLWANRQADLEKTAATLDASVAELKEKVESLDNELKSFQPGSPAAMQLQGEVFTAIGEYNAQRQFANLKLESLRAEAMRQTYEEIQQIAKAYAQKVGIDFVLVDDSIPEMVKGNSARTVQQISARRLLFATQEFNVTRDLLDQLNAKFPLNPGVTLKPADKDKDKGKVNADADASTKSQ
ncbi:MAG: OmpH family outer membrane protein [Phycisphaerales bacterium]